MKKENLKRNDTAKDGSLLYLTKKLGIGIITTAQKKGIVSQAHLQQAVDAMLTLNKPGSQFGKLPYVNAMTDVTGFGLLGHLVEMCEGSTLSAEINFKDVPKFDFLREYIQQKSMPGGTQRNWESYGHKISAISDEQKAILADPQTSGGLLVSVDPEKKNEFEAFTKTLGLELKSFGKMTEKKGGVISVA
jgi:selenide,water dikinase